MFWLVGTVRLVEEGWARAVMVKVIVVVTWSRSHMACCAGLHSAQYEAAA